MNVAGSNVPVARVGVLGCGLMGAGIAEVCARAGYDTVVREVSEDLVNKGVSRIRKSLDRAVEKGRLPAAERDAASARLRGVVAIEALADRDLVIEAIVEHFDDKRRTFQALDPLLGPEALLASNTSSLTITPLAAATGGPSG